MRGTSYVLPEKMVRRWADIKRFSRHGTEHLQNIHIRYSPDTEQIQIRYKKSRDKVSETFKQNTGICTENSGIFSCADRVEKGRLTMSRSEGVWGEALVADYLREKGYKLAAHSYRCRFGEISLSHTQ